MSRPWNREQHSDEPIKGSTDMTMDDAFRLAGPKLNAGRF
jgi:hypothetical protein